PIQWRVGLHLVGDRHSEFASSAFYPLPAEPFPGGGQLATHSPSAARSRLNETVVEAVYLAGPGGIEFTNGVVATNFVADLPHGGVSHSTSSSTDGQGNHVASLRLESVTPMIVAGIKGPTDGLWFSCRVENLNTGKSFWLTQHGGPKDSHGFLRLYERNQLVWWSTEKLDTNVVWKIEVGVHRPQRFEFVVDRPEWVPKE
ncbi:MAG TPA: hypothetical protein DCY13_15935, partial [Verrucomicrobiales bacterium]|nr:hypothetical protein [Verrucomicrobiales bacterium]